MVGGEGGLALGEMKDYFLQAVSGSFACVIVGHGKGRLNQLLEQR